MMSLPVTHDEILAMGRDALQAVVRFWAPFFGLQTWRIAASWVESEDGSTVAGWCDPDDVYRQANIGIVWPPVGDVEETIVHELTHCARAALARLSGAYDPDSAARVEAERDAEQTARGLVALRRNGGQMPALMARFCRNRFAALRRHSMMDPVKLAELAMKAGEMAGREDVPEDVKQLFAEFVAAIAGGGAETEADPGTAPEAREGQDEDPTAAAPMNAEEQVPGYARTILDRLAALEKKSAPSPAPAPAVQPSPELAESRRNLVQSFLMTKPGILSSEMERQLVSRGDLAFARTIVSEVERRPVQRAGAKPPEQGQKKPALTPAQEKMARRHKLTDEQFADSFQRQNDRKAARGFGGN